MGECIVGKCHKHTVGHSLVERNLTCFVGVVRFVDYLSRTRSVLIGAVDSHSGDSAFAKHLVAEVDYIAHLVALVHLHIARIVVVVNPSALWERKSGKCEVVVAQNKVEDIGIVRDINRGEQVVAQIDILQFGVFAKVDFGKVVTACKEVEQLGVVGDVEVVHLGILMQ